MAESSLLRIHLGCSAKDCSVASTHPVSPQTQPDMQVEGCCWQQLITAQFPSSSWAKLLPQTPQPEERVSWVLQDWQKIRSSVWGQTQVWPPLVLSQNQGVSEETQSERDTCTPMFFAALFIIARTWKQPRCPSADEWIRKLLYIYTMEYYSAIKKNSFESVLMR